MKQGLLAAQQDYVNGTKAEQKLAKRMDNIWKNTVFRQKFTTKVGRKTPMFRRDYAS